MYVEAPNNHNNHMKEGKGEVFYLIKAKGRSLWTSYPKTYDSQALACLDSSSKGKEGLRKKWELEGMEGKSEQVAKGVKELQKRVNL